MHGHPYQRGRSPVRRRTYLRTPKNVSSGHEERIRKAFRECLFCLFQQGTGMPDNLVYAPARGWRHIQAIRHNQRPHVCGSGKRTEEIKELRLNKSLADTNGALVLDGACECAHWHVACRYKRGSCPMATLFVH